MLPVRPDVKRAAVASVSGLLANLVPADTFTCMEALVHVHSKGVTRCDLKGGGRDRLTLLPLGEGTATADGSWADPWDIAFRLQSSSFNCLGGLRKI